MLSLRLPVALEVRLNTLARKTGRTKSYYARKAIVDCIDDLEDLYLARGRCSLIDRGKSRLVSLGTVEAQLAMPPRPMSCAKRDRVVRIGHRRDVYRK